MAAGLFSSTELIRQALENKRLYNPITNGPNRANPTLPRDRDNCVSLLVRGPCWSVGLHRDNDLVRSRADDRSTDRADSEHLGRDHRFVSILAGRIFFL